MQVLTGMTVIFPQHLLNPKAAAEDSWDVAPSEDQLPSIRRPSDIMTAYWLRGNPNPKNLRYYFVINVQNRATLALLAKIFKDGGHGQNIPLWPGITFTMDQPEAEVLLGSYPTYV